MTYAEALELVSAGKVVSRSSWPVGFWIGERDGATYIRTTIGRDFPYAPTPWDREATDWQPGSPNHA